MRKSRSRKKIKSCDEAQVDEVIKSLRICSQCSTCTNCMFKTMKDEYEREAGGPEFTCQSALMDAASELLCIFSDWKWDERGESADVGKGAQTDRTANLGHD